MQNAPHSAILLTRTKLPHVLQTFVLSMFERPLKTGFIVYIYIYILKEKRNATDKHIIFACLNDGLVKSLLKISY